MTPLVKPTSGNHPLADVLNVTRQNLRERTPLNGPEIIFETTPDGFRAKLRELPAKATDGSVNARIVLVSEVFPDYLVCRSLEGGEVGTAEILVAKPQEIRQSTWDGNTLRSVSYSAVEGNSDGQVRTADGRTETLTPKYVAVYPYVPPTILPDPVPASALRGAVITIIELETVVITTTHRGSSTGINRIDINDAGRQFLSPSGGTSKQFQIESVAGGYLECREYDAESDTISGERVIVSRPPTLQRPEGGDTQTRTIDGITEKILPAYNAGQVIYGLNVPEAVDVGNQFAQWVDANVDARRWELPMINIPVCENGVTRYLQARANGPGDYNSQTGSR